jgi:hypothetical protein
MSRCGIEVGVRACVHHAAVEVGSEDADCLEASRTPVRRASAVMFSLGHINGPEHHSAELVVQGPWGQPHHCSHL